MEEQKNSRLRKILVPAIVIALLFGLPAGSWLYLQRGLDYRKQSLSELSDLGKPTSYQLKNQRNLEVGPESFRGRVTVVNFLPNDREKALLLSDRMAKVHQSFDDTEDVFFLTFMPVDTSQKLLDIALSLGIKDDKQWYLIGTQADEWQRLASEVYKIPDPANGVALVDTSLTIRKYYDINLDKDMGRLVEHIAIVIPQQKRR